MTVTPVLADQLEAAGRRRAPARLPAPSSGSAPREADVERRRPPSAATPAGPSRRATARALARLDALDGDLLRAVPARGRGGAGRAHRLGGDPRGAAAARHPRRAGACRSTPGCARTGAASASRRGFWLPECAYEPGLERLLAERGVALLLHRPERHRGAARRRWRRSPTEAGPVALTIDWEAIQWLWSLERLSLRPGPRRLPRQVAARRAALDDRRRAATTRRRPRRARAAQAGEFLAAAAARLREFRAERGRRGLLVFAIDTELLGHWWWEGPVWLARGARRRRRGRGAAAHRARGARRARAGASARCAPRAGARARTCAPGTRPRSPTSPGPRGGSSCGCCARSRRGPARPTPPSAPRASCSRSQASDWAFLDQRAPGRRLRLPARHRPLPKRRWRP